MDNHKIGFLTDSLAVYNLFAQLDPTAGLNTITNILKASSNAAANTLESAVSALGKLFLVNGAAGFNSNEFDSNANGRDLLYTALNDITAALPTNGGPFTLRDLTSFNAAQIASVAQDNLAYRYALHELNPFALLGNDAVYAQHNTHGELDVYDPATRSGTLSQEWLTDRAAMLGVLMARNTADAATASTDTLYTDADSGITLRSSSLAADNLLKQIRFGSDDATTPETISGGLQNDRLYGMGGNDTLNGDYGNDYLEGGQGDDLLYGGFNNDTLAGGQGNDTYRYLTGEGLDTILDSDGLGKIYIGADLLNGGESKDGGHTWISADGKHSYALVSGDINSAEGATIKIDGSLTIQHYRAGDLGLQLAGAATQPATRTIAGDLAWKQFGTAANGDPMYQKDDLGNYIVDPGQPQVMADNLNGSSGNDAIYGGAVITAAQAIASGNTDTATGQQNDWLTGHSGDDTLIAGAGNDALCGGGGSDLLIAGAGGDYILGDADYTAGTNWSVAVQSGGFTFQPVYGNPDPADSGSDIIYAGGGNDHVWAGSGNDIALGEGGDDTLGGEDGEDLLDGGMGNDTLYGGAGSDTLYGGAGDDNLYGDDIGQLVAGNNYLDGEDGNDTLYGDKGDDTLLGGTGDDKLYGGAGTNYLEGGDGSDVLNSGGPGSGLFGGAGNDDLSAIGNANYLDGGDNNDSLTVNGSNNSLFGGAGDDTLSASDGYNYLDGGDGANTLAAIDGNNELFGGTGNDNLAADGGSNYLDGGDGNNTLTATGGNNELFGGTGDDKLSASGGYNYLDGGDGANTLIAKDGNNELFGGAGNDNLAADGGSNYLDGGAGDNTLGALGGNNRLIAGAGNDNLQSGGGNSYLDAGDGTNTLIADGGGNTLLAGAGDDSLSSAGGTSRLDAGDGNDTLIADGGNNTFSGGAGNDQIYAYGANNTLDGSAGNDKLYGGNGNDTLAGGTGDDYLAGGAGNDVYVYNPGDGIDHIVDSSANGQINTLRFGAGIKASDIVLSLGSLKLDMGNGDIIHIDNFDPNDAVNSSSIQRFEFADGAILTAQELLARGFSFNGTDGNDTLTGTSVADTLDGGNGNDVLQGGAGNDTYLFGKGAGQDTIYENDATAGNVDTVRMADGVLPKDVVVKRDEHNLYFSFMGATGGLTVQNWFDGDAAKIEQVVFADGTVWDAAMLGAKTNPPPTNNADTLYGTGGDDVISGLDGGDTLYGLAGNDTLNGGYGNDKLIGGAGNDTLDGGRNNDTLTGGAGNDTYLFGHDSGNDTVMDVDSTVGNVDTVRMDAGVLPSDVKVTRGGLDLYLTVSNPNWYPDILTLQNWFDGDASKVEQIVFANGTVWDAAALDAMANPPATDGADTLVGTGGDDVINGLDGNDWIRGMTGNDNLHGGGGSDALQGDAGNDVLAGDAGDDTLAGGEGNDSLEGGAGNDTLDGGVGNDTYLFGRGSGNDTVNDVDSTAGNVDTVRMAADVLPSDVTVTRNSRELFLSINNPGGTTDKLTLRHWFTGNEYKVEQVVFGDGTVWDEATLEAMANIPTEGADVLYGTAGDDVINGLGGNDQLAGDAGNDTLNGGDGNDVLQGDADNDVLYGDAGDDSLIGGAGNDTLEGGTGNDTLRGGADSDTYLFGRGSGQDTIFDNETSAGSVNTIAMAAGVLPTDVMVSRDLSNITLGINNPDGTKDSLVLQGWFGSDDYKAEQVKFGDGAVWDAAALTAMANTLTEGADIVSGTAGNDVINGLGGDDQIYGMAGNDTLNGGAGNDKLMGDFDPASAPNTHKLGGNDYLIGGAGNDLLVGGAGEDTLDGGAGDDTLVGGTGDWQKDNFYLIQEQRTLGSGNDTYLFGRGYENDLIIDTGGIDTVKMAADVLPTDVIVNRSQHDLILRINNSDGTTDRLTLGSWYQINGYKIEQVVFADGTTWNTAALETMANIPTEYADYIWGTAGDDIFNGLSGDDVLRGFTGNDTLEGGAGNDMLEGGYGNDTLVGGAGNDRLFGGEEFNANHTGSNVFDGGAGDDVLTGSNRDFLKGMDINQNCNDTYLFGRGYGQDTIKDFDNVYGNLDTVKMAAGLLPADVMVTRDQISLFLNINNPDGTTDRLTIEGWFLGATSSYLSNRDAYKIESVVFGDGTVWDMAALEAMANSSNAPPVLSAAIPNQISTQDAAFAFQIPAGTFADPDIYDKLTYSAKMADGSALPSWLTFYPTTGLFKGTPTNLNVGNLNVVVTATDMVGQSATGTFLLSVINVNDAPVAKWNTCIASEDSGVVTLSAALLLVNDTDPDIIHGDSLNIVGVGQAASGAAVSLVNGEVKYDIGNYFQFLRTGQNATDVFTYTIADSAGATSTAQVNMTINGANDAPETTVDTAAVQEDVILSVSGNVLANDSDVERSALLSDMELLGYMPPELFNMFYPGAALSVVNTGIYQSAYGILGLNANGSYTYTLNNASIAVQSLDEGQIVTETFAYQATDGMVATASSLTISITGTNDAPVVVADTALVSEDDIIAASGNVLANDNDADAGAALRVTSTGMIVSTYGALTLAADGTYSYMPNTASAVVQSLGRTQQVTERFDYTVSDGIADVASSLSVTVTGANDAPVVAVPLADQNVSANSDYSWQMPTGSFADADYGDVLVYTALLADGTPLPAWLTFDAATQTFSGLVPRDAAGYLDIGITATDGIAGQNGNLSATDVFRLSFAKGGGGGGGNGGAGSSANSGVGNGPDAPPPGLTYNFNDGAGTAPGNPGAKGGNAPGQTLPDTAAGTPQSGKSGPLAASGETAGHPAKPANNAGQAAAYAAQPQGDAPLMDDASDVGASQGNTSPQDAGSRTEELIRAWFDEQSVNEQYLPLSAQGWWGAGESQIDRQVNRSVSGGISGDVSMEWARMNVRLKKHLEQSGGDEDSFAESGAGSVLFGTLGSGGSQGISQLGNSQQMRALTGLKEGLESLSC